MSDTYVPQWLRDRQAEHARAAKLRHCHKCGAPVLVGFDADICALTVEIDPTPISEIGEALALIEGRRTYDLHAAKGQKEIHHRAEWNIAAARRGPVFTDHRCHQPPPGPATTPDPAPAAPPANPWTDDPPF